MRYLMAPLAAAVLLFQGVVARAGGDTLDAGAVRQARSPEGILIPFAPAADAPPLIGLFIGINSYPHLDKVNLTGSVNDALRLESIFTSQFGMRHVMMLTNQQATQAHIVDALKEVCRQAEDARKTQAQPVTVVICYSGHGSRVLDQPEGEPGHDEESGNDDTWVPSDVGYRVGSSLDGSKEIRDDDLAKVFQHLVSLKCQVVFISDSCHSGTMHRTPFLARQLVITGDAPAGPASSLFPDWPDVARKDDHALAYAPGLVSFTACKDDQTALEYEDNGLPCGRFTYVLGNILSHLESGMTYGELANRVALEFEQLKFSPGQTPQFYCSSGKEDESFLNGLCPPAFASIVPHGLADGKVRLNMGEMQGVTPGAQFVFYSSTGDLAKGRHRLGTGKVQTMDSFDSDVVLDPEARIDQNSVAALDAVRFNDFKVFADPGLAPELAARLRTMSERRQIDLTDVQKNARIFVKPGPGDNRALIYSMDCLPASGDDHPLAEIGGTTAAQAADNLASWILYSARVDRLLSLEYSPDTISTDIATFEKRDGRLVRVTRQKSDRVLQLHDGDQIRLTVENQGVTPLYFYVLAVDDNGALGPVYPSRTQVNEPVRGSVELPNFVVEKSNPQRSVERTRLKIIGSNVPVNIYLLTAPPQTGTEDESQRRTGGGENNQLFHLLSDLMHGGELTRAGHDLPQSVTWATAGLIFDIQKNAAPPAVSQPH